MEDKDVLAAAYRLSEDLRKAILNRNHAGALDVFSTSRTAFGGDSLAIEAILIGEMVQMIYEADVDQFAVGILPELQPLFDDFSVLGRSEEFYSELACQFLILNTEMKGVSIAVLAGACIELSQMLSPDDANQQQETWDAEVLSLILAGDPAAAKSRSIQRCRPVSKPFVAHLAVECEMYLNVLNNHPMALDLLPTLQPLCATIVEGFREFDGRSRQLSTMRALAEIEPESLDRVLISLVSLTSASLSENE